MAKVFEIAICNKSKDQMISVNNVEAKANSGLVNDRYFIENNDKKSQITLIEIENINEYNKNFEASISPIQFRRNIITKGIKLNELVGKEFIVGEVKLKAHDLCRPCKSLQEELNRKNIIKEFLHKGGIRCEILCNGKIQVGDKIKL